MRRKVHRRVIESLEQRILLADCWTFLTAESGSAYEGSDLRIGLQCLGIGPGVGISVQYSITPNTASTDDFSGGTSGTVAMTGGYGTANGEIVIPTLKDNLVEGDETLTLTLVSSSWGYLGRPGPPGYSISASLVIVDDPPIVSIGAGDASATENAQGETPDPGEIMVYRSGGDITQPLTVTFTGSGSAIMGSDYELSAATIPAGQSSTLVLINIIDDDEAEGIESAVIAIAPNATQYIVGTGDTAYISIDDNVSVKSIVIERGAQISGAAYGLSFNAEITVSGEHVERLEIRQLIKAQTGWQHWNGNPMTTNEIMDEVNADPVVIDSGGEYTLDTGWDWKQLQAEEQSSGGVAVPKIDSQLINVTNRSVTIGNTIYTQIRRAWTQRDFIIEVREVGTIEVLETAAWGYTWNNDNAAWTALSNPPPPVGDVSARGDLGAGSILGQYGIDNLLLP